MKDLNTRLKRLRQEKGWTTYDVAEKLGFASQGSYHKMETGKTKITIDKLESIAELYGVSIAYLLGFDGDDCSELEGRVRELEAVLKDKEKIIRLYEDDFWNVATASIEDFIKAKNIDVLSLNETTKHLNNLINGYDRETRACMPYEQLEALHKTHLAKLTGILNDYRQSKYYKRLGANTKQAVDDQAFDDTIHFVKALPYKDKPKGLEKRDFPSMDDRILNKTKILIENPQPIVVQMLENELSHFEMVLEAISFFGFSCPPKRLEVLKTGKGALKKVKEFLDNRQNKPPKS